MTGYLFLLAVIFTVGGVSYATFRWFTRPLSPTVEGATEEYADKLAAMRHMPPPVDLPLKPAEQMVADHEALAGISTALDEFDRNVSDAISRFLRTQPRVLLRLPASIEHTGEFPVVEMAGAS